MIVQDRYTISDNEDEQLQSWLRANLYDVHTSIPCTVVNYNSDGNVRVSVGVQRDIKGQARDVYHLYNVPVVYPRGKNFSMTWPIEIGDTGVLSFCESSIDKWLEGDGIFPVNPEDIRMHDYSDAVFIPGLNTYSNSKRVDKASIKYYNTEISMEDNGQIDIKNDRAAISISSDGAINIKNDQGKVSIDNTGKFGMEGPLGELFSTLLEAITLADHIGAASVPINLARQMIT